MTAPAQDLDQYVGGYFAGFAHGWEAALTAARRPEPRLAADAWEHTPGSGWIDHLPPDLTDGGIDCFRPVCDELWRGYACTRRRGHTGRHACGVTGVIVAVWRTTLDVPATATAFDDEDVVPATPPPLEACS